MEQNTFPEFTEAQQKIVATEVAKANTRHNRALWKTRISVSMITSLIISCIVSITAAEIISHSANRAQKASIAQNCSNIKTLRKADRSFPVRAERLVIAYAKKHHIDKSTYNLEIHFYNSVINQYNHVHCVN